MTDPKDKDPDTQQEEPAPEAETTEDTPPPATMQDAISQFSALTTVPEAFAAGPVTGIAHRGAEKDQ